MRKTSLITLLLMFLTGIFSSCGSSDDGNNGTRSGKPYDPSQPIKLTTFYPQDGGMATKVIIKGENFGTDLSQIEVFLMRKRHLL